jgi:Tat protein secretion system quality control protein TatD with DNase activity
MLDLVELGFYIGINGCSLRELSDEVVKSIPLENLVHAFTVP